MVSESIQVLRQRIILGLLDADPKLARWLKAVLKVYVV